MMGAMKASSPSKPHRPHVRNAILHLWRRAIVSQGFATDLISQEFRRNRQLGSHDRREVSETLYSMLRNWRRLVWSLGTFLKSDQSHEVQDCALYLAHCVTAGLLTADWATENFPGPNWQAVARLDERIEAVGDPVTQFGLRHSLPDWMATRFMEQFGGLADALAASLNQRAPLTVRTNTLKIQREDLAARLAEEGVETTSTRFAPHGLHFASHINAFALKSFRDGLFEVQDEASQLASLLVAPPPGSVVVDLCAGAGGKTLAIAAQLGNRGRVLALDVHTERLKELVRRARRAGTSNVKSMQIPAEALPPPVQAMTGRIARVLTDVPCSGLGAMRRNPETRWRLQEEELGKLPALQEAIARRGISLLGPGGRLVYATCTLFREENEAVVEALLAADPSLEPVRITEIWGKELAAPLCDPTGYYLKLFPHVHGTDGFFAAVLRRKR